MYMNKFVLSIISEEGYVLREFGPNYNRQVGLPFDSEYKIRLRNKNDRDCAVRVFVDEAPLSNFGDIVLKSGNVVDIERFISDSMNTGRKLKFVPLSDSKVNDPYSSENGVVRVEFRLAKYNNNFVTTTPPIHIPNFPIYVDPYVSPLFRDNSGCKPYWQWQEVTWTDNVSGCSVNTRDTNSLLSKGVCAGATVEGNVSNQQFLNMYIDVEPHPSAVLKLRIVGLENTENNVVNNFCTKCGKPWIKGNRFCGNCGNKF